LSCYSLQNGFSGGDGGDEAARIDRRKNLQVGEFTAGEGFNVRKIDAPRAAGSPRRPKITNANMKPSPGAGTREQATNLRGRQFHGEASDSRASNCLRLRKTINVRLPTLRLVNDPSAISS
jgi:hypothetical protein